MIRNRFLLTGLLAVVLVVIYYSVSDNATSSLSAPVEPSAYSQQLLTERQKKDEFLRTDPGSPITDKAHFTGLVYYAPDPAYRLTAQLEPVTGNADRKLVIHLTDGTEEVYERFAYVVFRVGKTPCRLLLLKHDDTYSILFRDETSGTETYGGGRYLDLDPKTIQGNQVLIDFNMAYNPYCAYNHTYACPLPPPGNKLPIAIRAGEKLNPDK